MKGAIICTQTHSDALRRTQAHSDALRRNQTYSGALIDHMPAISMQ
jgi:hypothetical protein